jgi:hypothetical protein
MKLNNNTMTKIDNLKSLFEQVKDQPDFIIKVAEEFKVQPSTVRIGWIYRLEIPEKYNVQDNLIVFTQNYIKCQNKVISE